MNNRTGQKVDQSADNSKMFGGVGGRSTLFIHISMEGNYHNLALLTNRIKAQLKKGVFKYE
jgi:hypothetical protein